jgi:hypothetical protein
VSLADTAIRANAAIGAAPANIPLAMLSTPIWQLIDDLRPAIGTLEG